MFYSTCIHSSQRGHERPEIQEYYLLAVAVTVITDHRKKTIYSGHEHALLN
jgi:hypothetical protein